VPDAHVVAELPELLGAVAALRRGHDPVLRRGDRAVQRHRV